jgi:hypothetical protein
MKPSDKCKAAGLAKGLAELSEITGVSEQTLNNWSKSKKRPKLFNIVINGAVAEKKIRQFHGGNNGRG